VAETRLVGDRALLRTFDDPDVVAANVSALACCAALRALDDHAVEDVVPGARSVLVVLRRGLEPPDAVLDALARDHIAAGAGSARVRDIPVSYGGDAGPDLADVARLAGLTEIDLIDAHAAPTYVVGFIGFSPGFPYLLGLDPRLHAARLETPRVRVQPGSVGIGGSYTGIYPSATPGGWHLIGRTDVELFDPLREPPALLAPGDRVRFVPR